MKKYIILAVGTIFLLLTLSAQDSTYFSKHLNYNRFSQRGRALALDEQGNLYLSFQNTCNTLDGAYPTCGGLLKMDADANIEWVDTSRINRTSSGHYAFFWEDSLLYMGNVIRNEARDSQILLSAITSDNELIWETVLDTGIEDEGYENFIPYEDGFIAQIGMNFWSCVNCDTTRLVFFDHNRNIVRDWKYADYNVNPDIAGKSLKSLGDGTFIGTDFGCTVLALCGGVTRFDSLGNVLWQEWLDQTAWNSRISVPDLAMLPDKDFVVSWISSYTGEPSFTTGVPVLYRMNKEGEFVWTRYFDHDLDQELFVDEIRTAANGDIIGFGRRYTNRHNDASSPDWVDCGYICRVSPDGEILWERTVCDFTGWFDLDNFKYPYMTFRDMVELPNGDLFFTGEIWVENPENPDQYTTAIWLVKTDNTGCMEPDCGSFEILTSSEELLPAEDKSRLLVFPNPASDLLQLHLPGAFDGRQYHWQLTDAFGRILLEEDFLSGTLERKSVASLATGIYFWQLYGDGVLVDTGKVVKN